MRSSTCSRSIGIRAALLLITILLPATALAARPTIGVLPLGATVPNTGQGLAELLARGIADCGPWQIGALSATDEPPAGSEWLGQLPGDLDYVLSGQVVAFTIADRDQLAGFCQELADFARLLGEGGSVAHVALDLELWRVEDQTRLARWQVEAIESRRGTRLNTMTLGRAGSWDYLSDEFRQSQLGQAAYKAVGEVLYELIDVLPLTGHVLGTSGDAVVVDLGSNSGIAPGDELTLYESAGIADSMGRIVWESDTRAGSVEVVEVTTESCLCLIVDAAGPVTEGMIARPLVSSYVLPAEADSG